MSVRAALFTLCLVLSAVTSAADVHSSPFTSCPVQEYQINAQKSAAETTLSAPSLLKFQTLKNSADLDQARSFLSKINAFKTKLVLESDQQVSEDLRCLLQAKGCRAEDIAARIDFFTKEVTPALKAFRVIQALAFRPIGDGLADQNLSDLRQQIDYEMKNRPSSLVFVDQEILNADERKVATDQYHSFWKGYAQRLMLDLVQKYSAAKNRYEQENIGRSLDLVRKALQQTDPALRIRMIEGIGVNWIQIRARHELAQFRGQMFKAWFNLLAKFRILANLKSSDPGTAEFARALTAALGEIQILKQRLENEAREIEQALKPQSPLLALGRDQYDVVNHVLSEHPEHCRIANQLSLLTDRSQTQTTYILLGSILLAPVAPIYIVFPGFTALTFYQLKEGYGRLDQSRNEFYAFTKPENSYAKGQQFEETLSEIALTEALLPLAAIGGRPLIQSLRGLIRAAPKTIQKEIL